MRLRFVGPSSCGKSTTLRMIAGFEDITGGDLYIDGTRVNEAAPKDRGISMVFRNYALYPHMTVVKNIGYGLKNLKVPEEEIKKKVDWAIDFLGLEEYRYRKPKNLSGGQRQRIRMESKIKMKQKLHLKAPGNWINDPNGFIYYKGKYHLFYQYFPYEPRWGTMHWGHAVSDDLLTWEHKGIALFPSKYADQNGCFSGSAVEADGRMRLFYTGVHYHEANPEDIHVCLNDNFESAQLTISSEDGFHFDNANEKSVIIPPLENPKIGDRTHTRDPKVWKGKDAWYMVLGSSTRDKKGEILIYRSSNLRDWEYKNRVTKGEGFGWMWECPDYFEAGGEKVLIFSPMGILEEKHGYENQTVCTLVDFEESTCEMTIPDAYQFFDYGLDLYAPQSTVDKDGRRVIIAWLRMPKPVNGEWSGMFCLPRVVEVCNGHIYFRPHPDVKKAYSKRINSAAEAHESGYRISMNMEEEEMIDVGGYKIFREGGCIHTDRSAVFADCKDYRMQLETPVLKDGCHVDIYVDANLIEVFVNDGEYVISNAVYGLKNELQTDGKEAPEIYTVE